MVLVRNNVLGLEQFRFGWICEKLFGFIIMFIEFSCGIGVSCRLFFRFSLLCVVLEQLMLVIILMLLKFNLLFQLNVLILFLCWLYILCISGYMLVVVLLVKVLLVFICGLVISRFGVQLLLQLLRLSLNWLVVLICLVLVWKVLSVLVQVLDGWNCMVVMQLLCLLLLVWCSVLMLLENVVFGVRLGWLLLLVCLVVYGLYRLIWFFWIGLLLCVQLIDRFRVLFMNWLMQLVLKWLLNVFMLVVLLSEFFWQWLLMVIMWLVKFSGCMVCILMVFDRFWLISVVLGVLQIIMLLISFEGY